jgi:hypothetical protein
MYEHPSIHGTKRLEKPQKFLVAPLPKIEASLRSVAEELEGGDPLDKRVAEVLRKIADEIYFWL